MQGQQTRGRDPSDISTFKYKVYIIIIIGLATSYNSNVSFLSCAPQTSESLYQPPSTHRLPQGVATGDRKELFGGSPPWATATAYANKVTCSRQSARGLASAAKHRLAGRDCALRNACSCPPRDSSAVIGLTANWIRFIRLLEARSTLDTGPAPFCSG